MPEKSSFSLIEHFKQGAAISPEAAPFDSAKDAIDFLNSNSFNKLFPGVDLSDPGNALKGLEAALQFASNPEVFLYRLGPNLALIQRILEWAFDNKQESSLREVVVRRAQQAAWRYSGVPFGFIWKATWAAVQLPGASFPYQQVDPAEVAASHYWHLSSHNSQEAEPLKTYIDRFLGRVPAAVRNVANAPREAVFVCQMGSDISRPSVYGSMRVTIENAEYLARSGCMVLLMGRGSRGLGTCRGIPFVAAENEKALSEAIEHLGLIDALIGISRADVLRHSNVRRHLVYQLGPHPPQGNKIAEINATSSRVACVSRDSVNAQMNWGIRPGLLSVIYPGGDHSMFKSGDVARIRHSITFAGNIVRYKGVDIALRAFQVLRRRFPDAAFHIHGRTEPWRKQEQNLLDPAWIDEAGNIICSSVERDLPGVMFHGHVPVAELARAFQRYSLLVLPSRNSDTFGLVSVEAQACGCIPVLPRCCGFPETMREGITGYVYDQNSPEALAEVITELWEKALPTDQQRLAAEQWAREQFSWDKSGADLLNLLQSIHPRRRHRRLMYRAKLLSRDVRESFRGRLPQSRHILRRMTETSPVEWPHFALKKMRRNGQDNADD